MKHIKQRIMTTIALIVVYGLGFAKVIPFTFAAILALIILFLSFSMQHYINKKENKDV